MVSAEKVDISMLKRSLTWLAMAMFTGIFTQAQQAQWAPAGDANAKFMLDAERQWEEAACDHNKIAETILADDFWGTLQDGTQYGKAEEVKATQDRSTSARECRISDTKVRLFGDDLAVVYGRGNSVREEKDGRDRHQCLSFTDTWLKRSGKWQIIASHDTELPCK
jgi:hypothetical protein